jgi:hypothetical protein
LKASANLDRQLQYGAHLVLSRDLTETELATLRGYGHESFGYAGSARLLVSAAPAPNSGQNRLAMMAVAGVLLNLDAALTSVMFYG